MCENFAFLQLRVKRYSIELASIRMDPNSRFRNVPDYSVQNSMDPERSNMNYAAFFAEDIFLFALEARDIEVTYARDPAMDAYYLCVPEDAKFTTDIGQALFSVHSRWGPFVDRESGLIIEEIHKNPYCPVLILRSHVEMLCRNNPTTPENLLKILAVVITSCVPFCRIAGTASPVLAAAIHVIRDTIFSFEHNSRLTISSLQTFASKILLTD